MFIFPLLQCEHSDVGLPGMQGDFTTAVRTHFLLDLTQIYASVSTVSCRQPICQSFRQLSERLTEFSLT